MPGGRPLEWTPEKYEALAKELIEWAKEPKSCHLAQFTGIRYGKTRQWLYSLCELSDTLNKAWKSSKEIIASKYVSNGLYNEWNGALAKSWAPVYDDELKAFIKEVESWKKANGEGVMEAVLALLAGSKFSNKDEIECEGHNPPPTPL